jgi:signal transduction histidine kinase
VSIKAKQVAGVTTLVVVVVVVLSAYHLATLTRLKLEDTASRGEVLANAIFLRAADVVAQGGADPYAALREDGGVRSILLASVGYTPDVIYAMILNKDGVAVAQSGLRLGEPEDLKPLMTAGPIAQLRAVYSDRTFEVRLPMLAGDQEFGSVFVGVSNSLLRSELRLALLGAGGTVFVVLLVSALFAMLLSQWMLRPIHVIQSGLSRLGRGELDVRLDLPEQEFRDLGSSFDAVSAQLSAMGRGEPTAASSASRPGGPTDLESVMHNLEDAVALFSPRGELIFCNRAMNALHPGAIADFAPDNPIKQIVERTIAGRKSQGPVSIRMADASTGTGDAASPTGVVVAEATERLVMSHAIEDTSGRFLGAMLVARNIGYLNQVHSTLNYSRKLSALGRLMAGVAHEVKNPLNAMTIHLELLKQKLIAVREPITVPAGAGPARRVDVSKHVDIIGSEIHRLDEVVNGFLKFARPDELKLQPVHLGSLISDVATTAAPEAERRGVAMKFECAQNLPEINADPGMLGQALLNLALNACQAMPDGGTLKMGCRAASRGRVELDVEDTGVGIPPEHLGRIFDLYFTTKEKGSGIGLSMVYRIVQLHDGEVEVESTPGHGTKFRLIFPQA